MEVTIRRTEPIRAIVERFETQYGSLAGAQAALPDDPSAMEAVYWLKQVQDEPGIVEGEATTTTLVDVDPSMLAKLTVTRLRLIELVRSMDHASVKDVVAASGRDYKNVHNDLDVLEEFGFIQSHRHGHERIVQAYPAEMIVTSAA